MVVDVREGQAYKITNARGGTVIDLSGAGERAPITGYNFHDGPNQKWVLEHASDGAWRVKNTTSGLFLGLADDGGPENGRRVVASFNPAEWEIMPDKEVGICMRLQLKGSNLCLDLSDHGNPQEGTPVQLWEKWDGVNQVWKFDEV